ncbi:MAG: two-component regulator propeller domain-containing protein [Bacteroidales bacterium]
MNLRFFLFLFFLNLYTGSFAQLRIGEWRDHLPYNVALKVEGTPERIYCLTTGSLFYLDRSDNSLHKLSTVNGLSDISISAIRYDAKRDLLIIGYKDGKLDLLSSSGVTHISDISDKNTLPNKEINNIFIENDYAYLACGFGIVVLNLARLEIRDTYYIGENGGQTIVNDISTDDTYIYAATEMGLFRAEKNNPNLVNYSYWAREIGIPSSNGNFISICNYNGKIVTLPAGDKETSGSVYYLENGDWLLMTTGLPDGTEYSRVRTEGSRLVLVSTHWVSVFGESGQLLIQTDAWAPQDAWVDEENNVWLADFSTGFARHKSDGSKTSIKPNGPATRNAFRLAASADHVMVSGGGYDNSMTGIYNSGDISVFLDNKWSSWNSDSVRDVITILPDPANPAKYYAATWGYGVSELVNTTRTASFDPSNSSLQSIFPGQPYCRTYGLAFDDDHNLWVTNSGVSNPVSVRLNNGTWKSLPYSTLINAPQMGDILVTSGNIKWVSLPKGYGLFAFNEKGTWDNAEDDDYLRFQPTDNTGKVISSQINDMAEDQDGNIWLGTSSGPVVYYNPAAVFSEGGITANQVFIARNDGSGLGDYLLETESITAIAIDGANRKWFGTQNSGAYLMSPDGQKQIHHFTVENSPLFSNTINDITVNPTSGEVFFATPRGLVSYRDAATAGGETFGKVYVFPNPVRPDYTGDIIITGLAANVDVRITDIAGNLVYQTQALGGQAVWNGKNFDGRRVATGVYLVFCSNDDGTATYITKLLFIN